MGPVLRNKKEDKRRTKQGSYTKKCGTIFHNDIESKGSKLIYLQGRDNGIGKRAFTSLVSRDIIKSWTKHICRSCFDKFGRDNKSELLAEDSAGPSHENYDIVIEGSHQIDSVDEDLEDDEQDEDDKNSCDENLLDSCVSIGSKLKEVVKADVSALYNDKLKLNIENLLQYDCHDWLNRRPPELITLL